MAEKQATAAAFVRPEAVFTADLWFKHDFPSGMLVGVNMLVCKDTPDIIEKHLQPFFNVAENAALKDDKYSFLAKLKEEDRQPLIACALEAIESASKAAESLPPAHPPKLAVLFTKMTFYHDVMGWPEHAIALGERELEEAAPELFLLDEPCRDSAEIVGLIKETLKRWSDPISKGPENTFKVSLGTAPNGSPPPPVVPDDVPAAAVAAISFKNPGDWGYEVHEGPSLSEMRSRKMANRTGLMG